MFRNESSNQFDQNIDVYAGVAHPFFSDAAQQTTNSTTMTSGSAQTDNSEFSLQDIQQRLGNMTVTEDPQTTANSDVMPSTQTLNMSYQRDYCKD